MANLAGVVQQLRKERDQAARTVEQLDAALAALNGGLYGKRTGTRQALVSGSKGEDRGCPESALGKGAEECRAEQNVVSMPKKKTMSAAARRKIAAAQRARWAKVKAAQKKSA